MSKSNEGAVAPPLGLAPLTVHQINLTDNFKTTIYAEARKLLSLGVDLSDTIETHRNGQLSMTGNVGACARLMVNESNYGHPGLSLVSWKASPRMEVSPQDAQVCAGGHITLP